MLAVALMVAPALAQTENVGPPRQLVPTTEPIEVGPAPRAVPPRAPGSEPVRSRTETPAPRAGPTLEPSPVAVTPQQETIQVESLKAVDPSSVGILDDGEGAFGLSMWAGTSRSLVETLLPRLPARTHSRAMQSLVRRLLLSAAKVPEGPATVPSLLGLRIEGLTAAGDLEAVNTLLAVASANLDDKALAHADVTDRLLTGDNAGACKLAQAQVRVDDEPDWLKTLAFCKALEGQHAAASLGAQLLREQGDVDDKAFFTLIDALAGDEVAVVDSLIDPTALHLAMLRAAHRTIPPDAIEGTNPAILRVIATSPNADLEVRLRAAELAEAAGTLPTAALADIYASLRFSPEDLAKAMEMAESDPGPRTRALLYQVAQIEATPVPKAAALQKAWSLARQQGRFGTAARVNLEAALALAPSREVSGFAGDVGRALLVAGRINEARAWLDLAVQQASPTNQSASRAALELWPLVWIADSAGSTPWSPEALNLWIQAQQDLPEPERQARLSLMFSLLDGLGYALEDRHWQALLDSALTVTSYIPAPALWRSLEIAAEGGRLGETVMMALLTLGELGPGQSDTTTVRVVLTALRRVGLEADARAIALEAALANGI